MAAAAQPAIDLTRVLDERAITPLQGLVAILSGCILLVDGYDIQVIALAVPAVGREWMLAPVHFTYALSAAVLGMSIAGAFIAPLGDRFGRRTMLVGAMTLIGLATLLTATASSPLEFVLWRLLTGVGLGISIPNCNAWTAEYVPLRARATVLVALNAAIGIGAFSAGMIAPLIFAHWGWRGAFWFGGAIPLLIGFLIFALAPESLKFLLVRRPHDPRIPLILARIAPDVDGAGPFASPSATALAPSRSAWSVAQLLDSTYARRTLVLWALVAANLFVLYVLISWLPTLLNSAGWPLPAAQRGAALLQAGGVVGGLVLSLFVSRGKTRPALLAAFMTAAICFALFRGASPLFALGAVALIGCGTSGTQLSLNALSTAYYPPAIKATGMSWAGVVGNVAAFLAPIAGGWAIDRGYSAMNILAMLSVPALACALGALLMRREWQWN
ncbi:MAG TPA: MFS transporter [Steroidobacteraceae bacterium]|nr:MFS transporter [Steroidobacteraceae bacterium]